MQHRASAWWRAPLWLVQLATGYKSFVDNPILGSPALNRGGLHLARLRIAHKLAWWRRSRLARHLSPEDKASFDRDGYVCIRNFLPADRFARLQRQLLESPLEVREHRQGDTITRRVAVDLTLVRRIPELGDMLGSSRWKSLMRYVASTGGEPLYYLQSIVTGLDGPSDPQVNLHSDTFQPSLKAWFYLTDVEQNSAPLTYVAGSHRLTPARLEWEKVKSETIRATGDRLSQRGSFRISLDELAALGLPEPTVFAVPANTLVVADTYGFHARGTAEHPTVRAEIWAYRRRTPFLPWAGFDLLSLRWIAFRRGSWGYRAMDWLDKRGIAQQHWKPAGVKRATDR